jgi:hypothetical protein
VTSRIGVVAIALAACSSPDRPPAGPRTAAADAGVVGGEPAAADAAPPAVDDVVLVTDPDALAEIDAGTDLRARVGRWDDLARVLAADVERVGRADPKAGVAIAGNPHRLFDVRWLDTARFDLIGVVNRIDRAPVGGCGDVRLIYRLAYDRSRLPMTVAVIYAVDDDGADCRTVAAGWRPPAGLTIVDQARWLRDVGALTGLDRPSQVLVNLQQIRWPSAVRPDLGGHAEYLMRGFGRDGDGFAAQPLDNQPDVARLRKDRALRAELLAWIRDPDTLDRLDAGTAILPARFLTDRAVSVAPRGLARRANRPFRQLFDAGDLAGAALDGRRTIRSAEAVLRRLDEATCTGCHQSRTIAGFHLLGADPPDALAANALAVPMSSHLLDEEARRAGILAAIAIGHSPDWTRPFAERAADGDGAWGSHCGLGDPGFATWTCGAGLRCDRHDAPDDDAIVGVCVPDSPEVGDACEPWPIVARADPHRDSIKRRAQRACAAEQVCNRTAVGFPGGMCTADCDALPDHATCGAIAALTPFNNCLAKRRPFETCLADHVLPAGLRACDAARPCRDDYVCARASDGSPAGACIPPYFLFQLRVDGHR